MTRSGVLQCIGHFELLRQTQVVVAAELGQPAALDLGEFRLADQQEEGLQPVALHLVEQVQQLGVLIVNEGVGLIDEEGYSPGP